MARLNRVASFRGTSKTEDGNLTCTSCGDKIKPGDPYIWWANKQGRMSLRRNRCTKPECAPKAWEYQTTSPHIAAMMQTEEAVHGELSDAAFNAEDPASWPDEISAIVQAAADGVREVGEGYTESGNNIEEGFGNPTYQSEELVEKGEAIEGQADELESWEPADDSPPERAEFEDDDDEDADEEATDEAYGQALDDWAEAIRDEARDAVTEGCELP
jgi:hypothetical protein